MDESEIQAAQLNQQIAIVRSKIGEPVKDWSNEMIKRFLVARKNDIEKACEMLKNHLQWRTDFGTDKILEQNFPDINHRYKSGFIGYDKTSNPVYVEFPGKADTNQMLTDFDAEFLLRWHVCIMETGRKLYEAKHSNGVFVIIDCSGLSMAHCSASGIQYFRRQSALDQDNYPEHLAYCFIVNATWVFTTAWKMVSMFIDANTREKVKVLGADFKEHLAEYMDISQLPPELGGEREMKVSEWGADDPRWKSDDFTKI